MLRKRQYVRRIRSPHRALALLPILHPWAVLGSSYTRDRHRTRRRQKKG
nr:MAG TPA: hypothetical protein [Bacteriophage sp.]